MPFPEFDPVLIHLGPLPIRWYALAYVAGIVLGWWYASRLAKTERLWAPGKPPVTVFGSPSIRWPIAIAGTCCEELLACHWLRGGRVCACALEARAANSKRFGTR